MTPTEWIDTVIAKAPKLRELGVESLECEGCRVTLLPLDPPRMFVTDGPEPPALPDQDPDPLSSPATYPDGKVPGFERPGKSAP